MTRLLLLITLTTACGTGTIASTAPAALPCNEPPRWYDADGDGYGNPADPLPDCTPAAPRYVDDATDCDDDDAAVHPDVVWHLDVDGDGYGDTHRTITACWQPAGAVDARYATDCDDNADDVYPGAPEACDDVDNDCDGFGDDEHADLLTVYPDLDGDGFGVDQLALTACDPLAVADQPDLWVDEPGDCDDNADDVYPGAAEDWYDRDANCNGLPYE